MNRLPLTLSAIFLAATMGLTSAAQSATVTYSCANEKSGLPTGGALRHASQARTAASPAATMVGKIAAASPPARDIKQDNEWWKHAVFYEIYPRSFADAKNSGMGNLSGITSKLDYLKELGVDAIWITPCYPSPQVDFGYDVSDYCNIDPQYGTLADFDELVAQAKKRNIKILMDFVINHTSDQHPWFVESRSSKGNAKRDWYIWRDGKAGGLPPNNWNSLFGHSAWTQDPKTNQYYYHFFYPQQPDLNWRNPAVKQAMFDVIRFWLNRGVAGFRVDAICTMYEDPQLRDNPIKPGETNAYGDPEQEDKYTHMACQAEQHQTTKELRAILDSYPDHPVLIGETVGSNIKELSKMFGDNNDEIQLPMNFFFSYINKLSAPDFRKQIAEWDNNPGHGWPVYLFSNHDQVRAYDRYGDKSDKDAIAKLTAATLLTLRGSPILYYGEEIGMTTTTPTRVEDVKDPIGKIGWPKEKGRDGERTPMQWTADENAGFSSAKPWLPVGANYTTHNVAVEEGNPDSILSFYKSLIKLRRSNDALINGRYVPVNEDDQNVLSFLRQSKEGSVLVALNMSSSPQVAKFNLKPHHIETTSGKTLLSSGGPVTDSINLDSVNLPAYGVLIAEVH